MEVIRDLPFPANTSRFLRISFLTHGALPVKCGALRKAAERTIGGVSRRIRSFVLTLHADECSLGCVLFCSQSRTRTICRLLTRCDPGMLFRDHVHTASLFCFILLRCFVIRQRISSLPNR